MTGITIVSLKKLICLFSLQLHSSGLAVRGNRRLHLLLVLVGQLEQGLEHGLARGLGQSVDVGGRETFCADWGEDYMQLAFRSINPLIRRKEMEDYP